MKTWQRPASRVGVLAHAVLPFVFASLLPFNWLFLAVFWVVWNGSFAFLFLFVKSPLRFSPPKISRWLAARRGLAAALVMVPMGCVLVALQQWVADFLWSGYYPVNASLSSISFEVLILWENFAVILVITAIHAGASGRTFTPARLCFLLGLTFAGYFVASQAFLGLMAIPSWHLIERSVFPPWVDALRQVIYHLVTFIAIPFATATAYERWLNRREFFLHFLRGLATMVLGLAGLGFATGMPIYYALLIGMEHEKAARPESAIPWYGKALTWSRSDPLNAYLQFHMGLLWRKQNRLDLAHEAFLRVLVRYPHDGDLLIMAHEFESRLQGEQDSSEKRVVIPGIEARTEYKNAYCVPNSLGLVLNYWGDRTGAKAIGAEITQLDQGSFITDAVHFTEKRGLSILVLPLRELTDLFKLIDHGYPVLTFIPGHVLAVFGYDQVLQTLVTYDVNTTDIWDDQRWTPFQREWSQQFNTLAIVAPAGKLPELRQILGNEVDSLSEAYIQYLLAGISGEDVDQRAHYLKRTQGHDLFFATWEREELLGPGAYSSSEESLAKSFLNRYPLSENELLAYLRHLYRRGNYGEALDFIASYRKENVLSQTLQIVRAGCLAKTGKRDSAAAILSQEIDFDGMPAPLVHFLLANPEFRADSEAAKSLALDAMNQMEGLDGETAALALDAYLEGLGSETQDAEDAVSVLESYVVRHNPYDTVALRLLNELAPRKRFRKDDELNQESFHKRLGLYRQRRESLMP